MNARTRIAMDPEMQRRAQAKAAALGISFAEYVRRLVADDIGEQKPKADISIVFDLVDEGPPTDIARDKDKMIGEQKPKADISIVFDLGESDEITDIARDKDKMIGEAVWQEYLRKTGRKPRRGPKTKTVRS
jgi:hypothetical protein